MEKDRVRVMETGSEPETRPQKSNYRSSREGVGPAPRRIVSNSTKPCQTYTHKHTHTQAQEQKLLMNKRQEMDKIGEDHE